MTGSDVLVVGGGAIGLSSAWRLAQRGLAVEVLDPDPGGGASIVAAGMLAPVTEAGFGEEEMLRLGLASLARWPAFAAELDELAPEGPSIDGPSGARTDDSYGTGGVGFRADGTLIVAADADDRAALRDIVDRQRSLDLEVPELSVSELRELEPALAPSVRRGALARGECSVDPVAMVRLLLRAADNAGVVVRRAAVAGLLVDADERVEGVELVGGERITARAVVLAAGAWSGRIDGLPGGMRLPVRPVKGQVLTLRQPPDDTLVHHTVRGIVRGSSIYLVPRDDGRLMCGATVEERAWDPRPTAGGGYELLRDVLTVFPGLDEAELVAVTAGFRPGSPDNLPMIGSIGVEGLVVATGHFRNGILLTPITADAVAALVTGESPPVEVVPCDPGRFLEDAGMPGGVRP